MLTLLLPDQIMANWKSIKESVERALRPDIKVTESLLSNIQMALLDGKAQAWILYHSDVENNTSDIRAIVLTTITEDFVSGYKSLLIYSLAGDFVRDSRNGSMELWASGLRSIRKYAAKQGCESVSFYMSKKGAQFLAEKIGANVDNVFGYIGVENEDI